MKGGRLKEVGMECEGGREGDEAHRREVNYWGLKERRVEGEVELEEEDEMG